MCDADMIAACAVEALLVEAAATPKPGLVDRSTMGRIGDMDFFHISGSRQRYSLHILRNLYAQERDRG